MIRTILFTGLIALILIQFVRPQKNTATIVTDEDISMLYPMPTEIKTILHKACFDCHSNTTHYPWYSEIQPIGWWLQHHVNEGKEHLNFSLFGSYDAKRKAKKLDEIAETIKEQEMPLRSYTWIHRDANLTVKEHQILLQWVDSLQLLIPQQNIKGIEEDEE